MNTESNHLSKKFNKLHALCVHIQEYKMSTVAPSVKATPIKKNAEYHTS